VRLALAVGVGVPLAAAVGDELGVAVRVGVGLAVALAVALGVAVGVGEGPGVTEGGRLAVASCCCSSGVRWRREPLTREAGVRSGRGGWAARGCGGGVARRGGLPACTVPRDVWCAVVAAAAAPSGSVTTASSRITRRRGRRIAASAAGERDSGGFTGQRPEYAGEHNDSPDGKNRQHVA
jgi:hypothetical protein